VTRVRSHPEFIAVGVVLGPVGRSGALKVRPLSEFPGRLLELEKVRVTKRSSLAQGSSEWRRVTSAKEAGSSTVLTLEGVSTREQAATLRGAFLEIPVGQVKPLPEGSWYRFQLLGLRVEDEAGRVLGTVRDIIETGANDVFVVAPESSRGGRDEMLVPALKDVVLTVDPDAGRMVVRPQRVWGDDDEN